MDQPAVDVAAAAGGDADGAHLGTEYLKYLDVLSQSWSDCPAVEISFENMCYQVRNDATVADAAVYRAAQVRKAKYGSGGTSAVPLPSEENTPNLAKAVLHMATGPMRLATAGYRAASGIKPDEEEVLTALAPCSGIIRPGTMTLVLAPPGAGKSIFLRAISGRLSHDSGLIGDLRYNGLTTKECRERGIHVTRLASYVGQSDTQFPVLTVEETLNFAKDNGVADVELLNPTEKLREMDARRTELLMDMLGMIECRSTAIGSDLMRGISGGQRKRSQLGETLMSNARIYALDEVSNGLDSAVTLHIFSALKQACRVNSSSVVTALQQVTPETYALFDEIILLKDGHIVYHGKREGITEWLRDVMHVPEVPASLEEAGFLVDLLSDPKQAMEKAQVAWEVAQAQAAEKSRKPSPPLPEVAEETESATASSGVVRFHVEAEDKSFVINHSSASNVSAGSLSANSSPYKLSPADMHSVCDLGSLLARNAKNEATSLRLGRVAESMAAKESHAARTMTVANWSPYTKAQYGQEFPHSTLKHTVLACARESKLLSRNLTMTVPRLINALLMGLIYGTLFFQLDASDFASRLGIIQNTVMFMAFANFQELPVAAEGKQVVVRQINAGFYPAISYTTAVNLLTLPLACAEAVVFGLLVYFIPGFETAADRFFFFIFLLLTLSSAMSQTFRSITYMADNADVAQQLNMPFVMLFVVYGGFLIPRTEIQNWLIWAYYLSPFSWGTSALGLNEFSAGTYGAVDPVTGVRLGDSYLAAFGLRTEKVWQWAAVAFLWGFYLVVTGFSSLLLKYSTPMNPMGTKRPHTARVRGGPKPLSLVSGGADDEEGAAVAVDVTTGQQKKRLGRAKSSARESFQLTAMPFTPATLSWKDLKYTVYIGKDKTPRVLLNHISGYAEPGKLTALMGSSGAGKTTLLDVIAGRKTVGLIEHDSNIFVNGLPKDPATFAKITGYVEQMDIHIGTATVREALVFSAKLRLPSSVTDETRTSFVDEVMQLVGLTNVQHRMIGDVSQPSLSTGQLKLLTIAVELVANPSIIFLDEPTSGLDSKSAFRVMRAIKRIADTGRTIVCTIHQPSQEVFFMFDRLLLLRRGGETVYFDEIGLQGDTLVNYLTRVSRGLIPYSPLVSSANWMLDVVSVDASALIEEHRAEQERTAKEDTEKNYKATKGGPGVSVIASPKASVDSEQAMQQMFRSKLLATARSSARASGKIVDESKYQDVKPLEFSEAWRSSAEATVSAAHVDRYSRPAKGTSVPSAPIEYVSGLTRLLWVVRRAYLSHWRSPPINVTRCILMFIIGLFLGIVYYDLRVVDYAGMSSLLAAVFLGVSIPSSICSNASLSTFFRQRAVYYRERSVGMYGYKIYTATMSIVEAPYLMVGLLCFLLPFYFMVGLSTDAGLFFQFLLAGYLMVLFFASMEQVWISGLPNIIAAQALDGLFMSIFFAFGGLYIKASAIPIGWKWFYYLVPIPKAFIATMLTQVYCPPGGVDSGDRIDGCRQIEIPGLGTVELYDFARDMLEGAHHQYWWMIGYLCLSVFVVRAFSVLLFKTVNHIER